jgi:ABC-type nitrate/sulfonate/bicarbonate transport system substrate-binding protein
MKREARLPVRIGLMRLTDTAPIVLAQEAGLLAGEGLAAALTVEPSWANLADKLAYGLLDAAIMLPPLALAMALGLRTPAARLIVPLGLSLGGNAVTLSEGLATPLLAEGRKPPRETALALARLLKHRPRPIFAVVHAWSTHDLIFRSWLAEAGIDPAHDVAWSVVPPSEMVAALREGRIDGFCAGAPWGAVAAQDGVGRTVALSSEIWPNHAEKCLAVRADWAEAQPDGLMALLRALLRAAVEAGQPARAADLAEILADPAYVGAPAASIAASLPGGSGGEVDRSVFSPPDATEPRFADAERFLTEMARWRALPADAVPERVARMVYRPDLYRDAARAVEIG